MRFFVFLRILISGDIMKNKINAGYDEQTPPAENICDTPETVFEQINKYGTCPHNRRAETSVGITQNQSATTAKQYGRRIN